MKGGQLLASFAEAAFPEDAPFATLEEMLGLFVVMKLPQICRKASARSGPILAAAGPKSLRHPDQLLTFRKIGKG